MGHMSVKIHKDDQDFEGNCPYHGNCLEGLASGPAIEKGQVFLPKKFMKMIKIGTSLLIILHKQHLIQR